MCNSNLMQNCILGLEGPPKDLLKIILAIDKIFNNKWNWCYWKTPLLRTNEAYPVDLRQNFGFLFKFFDYFHTFNWRAFMFEVFYLYQTFTDCGLNILICQYAKCDCRLLRVLWLNYVFLWIFINSCCNIWNIWSFIKLLQIVR